MTSNDAGGGKYVTLVSSDGFEFVLLRQAVMISPAIKGMLDPRSECFSTLLDHGGSDL
jgi:transcription elongation factor B subunit 1